MFWGYQIFLAVLAVVLVGLAATVALVYPNPLAQRAVHNPLALLQLPQTYLRWVEWHRGLALYLQPRKTSGVVVVMVHGRSGNKEQNVALARQISDQGHGIFLFDQRSCGQNMYGPLDQGTKGALMVAEAARAAWKLSGKRVVLYGHSLGGTLVLQASGPIALQDEEQVPVVGVISDSAFYSWDSVIEAQLGGARWLWRLLLRPLVQLWTKPLGSDLHLGPYPITLTPNAPCLLIHSTGDPLVPFSELLLLYNSLLNRGQASMLPIDGAHWQPSHTKRDEAILTFLETVSK